MDKPEINLAGARILLVDDEPDSLLLLRRTLEAGGYTILVATSGPAAVEIAGTRRPDLILLDVMMPGMDGFETCRMLKARDATRDIPVLFVTARTGTEAVVRGFQIGGVDYIAKPFQSEEVLLRVQTHLKIDRLTRELARQNRDLQEEIARRKALSVERNHLADRLSMISTREAERWGIAGFVGKSRTIRKTLEATGRVRTTETSVLITGESGTGKELIARAIHHGSSRSSAPFVPVNCSAIPADLAESMLFGHIRGAFTGADRDRTGYFGLADGGTLFLDEIGDMPPDIQAKLLRVLEDGRVLPLGAAEERKVDVRTLAATNADLRERIASGGFRQDLYFRLARFTVHVPPLRERREDIPLLAQHFLNLFATEMGMRPPHLSPEVLGALSAYAFPGNVRELKNIVERALIESGGSDLCPHHLHFFHSTAENTPSSASPSDPGRPTVTLPLDLKHAEDLLIRRALEQTEGNIAAAARLLNTNRPRIYRYLEQQESPAGRIPGQ